jgi:hypothetical protein
MPEKTSEVHMVGDRDLLPSLNDGSELVEEGTELFSDVGLCSTCHLRLYCRSKVPVHLAEMRSDCALCRVLEPVVLDGFKSRVKSTVSAEFSTTFSWDKYGDFLKGGNDFLLLLSVWFEENTPGFCTVLQIGSCAYRCHEIKCPLNSILSITATFKL